jgi:hypothetical protein
MQKFTLKIKTATMLLIFMVLLSGCSSYTVIESHPSGANLYLDGEEVGQTPYQMVDTKIMFTCTAVRLEKEGHKPFYTSICRNEEADIGAIIGGVFFTIPFLWSMKYKPTHFYRLRPLEDGQQQNIYEDEKNPFEQLINEEE